MIKTLLILVIVILIICLIYNKEKYTNYTKCGNRIFSYLQYISLTTGVPLDALIARNYKGFEKQKYKFNLDNMSIIRKS